MKIILDHFYLCIFKFENNIRALKENLYEKKKQFNQKIVFRFKFPTKKKKRVAKGNLVYKMIGFG